MPVAQRSRRIGEGASGGPRAASLSLLVYALLKKMSFYLYLCPMNNEDKMIPFAAVTA